MRIMDRGPVLQGEMCRALHITIDHQAMFSWPVIGFCGVLCIFGCALWAYGRTGMLHRERRHLIASASIAGGIYGAIGVISALVQDCIVDMIGPIRGVTVRDAVAAIICMIGAVMIEYIKLSPPRRVLTAGRTLLILGLFIAVAYGVVVLIVCMLR